MSLQSALNLHKYQSFYVHHGVIDRVLLYGFRGRIEIAFDQKDVIKTLLEENGRKVVELEHLLSSTQEEKLILKANNRCEL